MVLNRGVLNLDTGESMKSLLALMALAIAFTSQAEFNCTQQEAQFIGTVRDTRVEWIDQGVFDCYFKIEFSRYNISMVCPLDISEAEGFELLDASCALKDGDEVSGILVKKDGVLFIE